MNGFKLLAIRPLDGCDKRFLKNLKPGMVYKFHDDYSFLDDESNEFSFENDNLSNVEVRIKKNQSNDLKLYDVKNDLYINVSAIVGGNGSGKSSLIDFFNLSVYYLSSYQTNKLASSLTNQITKLRLLNHFTKDYLISLKSIILDKEGAIFFESLSFLYEIDFSNLDPEQLLMDSVKLYESLYDGSIFIFSIFEKLSEEDKIKVVDLSWSNSLDAYRFFNVPLSERVYDLANGVVDFIKNISLKLVELCKNYSLEKEFENLIEFNFNFQIFYSLDDKVYKFQKIGTELDDFDESTFFYSIILNYSLHSMNSNHQGKWINSLFHKNDGYQTPLVINPYRERGKIDINSEVKLSIDRLIFNIIDDLNLKENSIVLSKYKFKGLILKLKTKNRYSFKRLIEEDIDYKKIGDLLSFLSEDKFSPGVKGSEYEFRDYILGYLIDKFRKISKNYMNHYYEYDFKNAPKNYEEGINHLDNWRREKAKIFIKGNNSHITKKFYQSYNFLLNYDQIIDNLSFIKEWDLNKDIYLSSENLKNWISFIKSSITNQDLKTDEIFLYLFPAIFDFDIEFENQEKTIKLSDFSSGEQQYLFNINTIVYHINNLKSVEKVTDGINVKYDNVNLILDEIELYYHPKFQKKLIKDVIDEISKIKNLGTLKNFNILLLTHSPFILSDIPSSNILRLENGIPSKKPMGQTFGANIHDLLANDFFLDEGFMGEFSKEKIGDLVKFLNNELTIFSWDENSSRELIEIVGEPILKMKLAEMYDNKFEGKFEIELLEERIKQLKKLK